MKKRSVILFALFLFLLCFGFLTWRYFTYFEHGENLTQVDWLPANASNVSYYKSYLFTAYEFDMPEKDFMAWSKPAWELEPIVDPVTISRFNRNLMIPKNPEDVDQTRATVSHGYFYKYRKSSGGGVTVVYDVDAGRAYVQHNPR